MTPLFILPYEKRNKNFCFRCECYHYLFDIATQMKSHGMDPCKVPSPPKGAYTSDIIL